MSLIEDEDRLNKILKKYENKVKYFFSNCSSDEEIECFVKYLIWFSLKIYYIIFKKLNEVLLRIL